MKPKDRTLCVHIQVMDFTKNILSHYFFLGLNPQPVCVLGLACVDSFNVVTRQVVLSQTRLDKCL